MRVVILGSGNVASVLGDRIIDAGHEVVQVYSRNIKHAATLGHQVKSSFTNDLREINTIADIYLIAVVDNAVAEVAEGLIEVKGLVIHTAGSVPLASLSKHATTGILYPLQSLRKGRQTDAGLPLLVDGSDVKARGMVSAFARSISSTIQEAGDEERLKLHVAAVFLNNFSNHLLTLGSDYCKREKLNFDLLKPLVKETASRLDEFEPNQVQTGPAVRNDRSTILKHQSMLTGYPDMSEIYKIFTEKITAYYTGQ